MGVVSRLGLAAALVLTAGSAAAHELIVQPERTNVGAGEEVAFRILSTHFFIAPEELENVDTVRAWLVQGEARVDLDLEPDAEANVIRGRFTLPDAGPAVLVAQRVGVVWSQTTQGTRRGGRDVHANALWSAAHEKFAKSLLNPAADADLHTTALGHALEIVPLDPPADLEAGSALRVQVLYAGEPIPAQIQATYDGHTEAGNTYAVTLEADAMGIATVPLDAAGDWIVRVQHRADVNAADHDRHVARAVLLVEVR